MQTSQQPISQEASRALRHATALLLRFEELEAKDGGRESLTPAERVDYDLIGGAMADLRRIVAKFDRTTGDQQ